MARHPEIGLVESVRCRALFVMISSRSLVPIQHCMPEKWPDHNPEPDDSQPSPEQPLPPFEAKPGQGLESIFDQLLEMQRQGKVLRGSERTYDAVEIAYQIRAAMITLHRLVWERNQSHRLDYPHDPLPVPDVAEMPELSLITRTNNLREAVRQALQEIADGAEVNINSGYRFRTSFFDRYRDLTGHLFSEEPEARPFKAEQDVPIDRVLLTEALYALARAFDVKEPLTSERGRARMRRVLDSLEELLNES